MEAGRRGIATSALFRGVVAKRPGLSGPLALDAIRWRWLREPHRPYYESVGACRDCATIGRAVGAYLGAAWKTYGAFAE